MAKQFGFENRRGVLATRHQKERVIAPLLQRVGIEVIVPVNFNSDRFGTFTREIKRPATQLATARLKAEAALAETGETLAIASEGSFYPHPALPLLSCDRELVLLKDLKNGLEIVGSALSTATNHAGQQIKSMAEALAFAKKIGFPDHGLVAMAAQDTVEPGEIYKGIVREADLVAIVEQGLGKRGSVYLETDMRAMYNPTRLKVIAEATQDLIHKLQQFCPQCSCPGFAAVEQKPGLPCLACRLPTQLILAAIYQCQNCQFQQEILFPDQIEFADPGCCNFCNP